MIIRYFKIPFELSNSLTFLKCIFIFDTLLTNFTHSQIKLFKKESRVSTSLFFFSKHAYNDWLSPKLVLQLDTWLFLDLSLAIQLLSILKENNLSNCS